ncbi:hypothetical protein [Chryseobacterium wanjuense]
MMVQNAVADYSLMAANIMEVAKESYDSHSSEYAKSSGVITFNAQDENIVMNTPKNIYLKSGEKSNNS